MAQAGNDLTANKIGGSALPIPLSQSLAVSAANAAKFQNVGTMRTALLGYGYTAAQLDIMSKNDMVFALKTKTSL